jgi:hypothetical protein
LLRSIISFFAFAAIIDWHPKVQVSTTHSADQLNGFKIRSQRFACSLFMINPSAKLSEQEAVERDKNSDLMLVNIDDTN